MIKGISKSSVDIVWTASSVFEGRLSGHLLSSEMQVSGNGPETLAVAVTRTGTVPAELISIEGGPSAPMPSPDGSPVPIPVGLRGEDFSFGFSTKYHDREVGLVAYQLRSYSPRLGRWLNRDPIEEAGGVNLYGFVNNMPLILFDLYGMHSFKFTDNGWIHEGILSGRIFDIFDRPVNPNRNIGVTQALLKTAAKCVCENGKYVPDYTFEVAVHTLIQNSSDPIWSDASYARNQKIQDPRVNTKWDSFLFFSRKRRINLVVEHEERHRKHAFENYTVIIEELTAREEFLAEEDCEWWAKEKIKSASWHFELLENGKSAKVERGEL